MRFSKAKLKRLRSSSEASLPTRCRKQTALSSTGANSSSAGAVATTGQPLSAVEVLADRRPKSRQPVIPQRKPQLQRPAAPRKFNRLLEECEPLHRIAAELFGIVAGIGKGRARHPHIAI